MEQPVATPSDATPEQVQSEQPEVSFDDKILSKFGLGESEPETEESSETPSEETEAPVEEVEAPVEDLFEIKHNGEDKKLPVAEARRLAQMGYDYEFKMQRVNEDARRVQGMAQAVQARAAMQAQALDALAEAKSYERQLKDYANVDWVQLSATADPQSVLQHRMRFDALRNAVDAAYQKANQLQQPVQQATQHIDANALALEEQKLMDRIPEWKDSSKRKADTQAIMEALTKSYGFAPNEIDGPILNDHRVIALMRDAAKYREALNTKGKKALPQGPKSAKPGTPQSPRSNVQRLGDIKRGLSQVQSREARTALEDELIATKFGLK